RELHRFQIASLDRLDRVATLDGRPRPERGGVIEPEGGRAFDGPDAGPRPRRGVRPFGVGPARDGDREADRPGHPAADAQLERPVDPVMVEGHRGDGVRGYVEVSPAHTAGGRQLTIVKAGENPVGLVPQRLLPPPLIRGGRLLLAPQYDLEGSERGR